MTGDAVLCPQCGAPLRPPGRFAAEATCAHCGTVVKLDPSLVKAARFQEALARWNTPAAGAIRLAGGSWRLVRPLTRGARTDLWHVERVRTPTERGILKLARDQAPTAEVEALERLAATGVRAVGTLLPSLIAAGPVLDGAHEGRHAVILRAAPTFTHDLDAARRMYPSGIDPAVVAWMWRRVLEVLRTLLELGITHTAVEPAHLVVERQQHGLRLVGFGHARVGVGSAGDAVCEAAATFLGVCASPPPRFGALLHEAARDRSSGASPAAILELHRRVGEVAVAEFGPPRFRPLPLPT